jgi:hypothetical protein
MTQHHKSDTLLDFTNVWFSELIDVVGHMIQNPANDFLHFAVLVARTIRDYLILMPIERDCEIAHIMHMVATITPQT